MTFYDGAMFPADHRGDAFVALHGSRGIARSERVQSRSDSDEDGRPIGGYDDFITGWMLDENSPDVWGRPVGVLVARTARSS